MHISPNEQEGFADVQFNDVDEMGKFAYFGFGFFSLHSWLLPFKAALLYRSNDVPRPETYRHHTLAIAASRMVIEANKIEPYSIECHEKINHAYNDESQTAREMAHKVLMYLSEEPLQGREIINLSQFPSPDSLSAHQSISPPEDDITT